VEKEIKLNKKQAETIDPIINKLMGSRSIMEDMIEERGRCNNELFSALFEMFPELKGKDIGYKYNRNSKTIIIINNAE
jgi:hypothetical protein